MAIIESELLLKEIQANRKDRLGIEQARRIIEAQPIVKAVPIEWMLEYATNRIGMGECEVIMRMLNKWRKDYAQ